MNDKRVKASIVEYNMKTTFITHFSPSIIQSVLRDLELTKYKINKSYDIYFKFCSELGSTKRMLKQSNFPI